MAAKKKKLATDLASQPDPRAPLDGALLLAQAQGLLKELEADLLARARASTSLQGVLRVRHDEERKARRTADPFEVWERHFVTQVAASWLLSCVFVRTLEDRGLLGHNRIAGPGAADSQRLFFELSPSLTEREYLLTVFRELTRLPAARELFDARHNPVWLLGPSSDLAKKLLALFRAPNAEAPALRFGNPDTRFLGDLYQDLSADVRERFALLQTPHFVEKYILDRTLERAIARFGLDETTLIDPTCGSGHFLLGAFERLVEHRLRTEPGLEVREVARRALDAVYGADINPYAVAIARFRLTLAFLERAGYSRLAEAPALPLHVVVADSLLHASQQANLGEVAGQLPATWVGREFALEDAEAAKDVLLRRHAAVVGNPPYITVKDAVLRERYRELYPRSAAGKYSLGAPFTERFFLLARSAGFVGMITANSFMKREFGKKLIEGFLPTVNLDGVVNTSGAYIPGHGTPTVLLFGSNESQQGRDVLTVLAKRGEPSTPEDAEQGEVWRSIKERGEELGFENEYVSVALLTIATLAKHPWSLGGGGASELKELLEERAEGRLDGKISSIGFMAITGEDEAFARPGNSWVRAGVDPSWIREFVTGEEVRDWSLSGSSTIFFPYRDARLRTPVEYPTAAKALWPLRRALLGRPDFGGRKYVDVGRTWYELHQVPLERLRTPYSITFAFVATHNHFVLDRGGKVFNRSAPIIKLKDGATEEDHLALLAYLNSSTACFWMKQVMMNKGGSGIGRGVQDEDWESRFEFDGTKLATVPIPAGVRQLLPLAIRMVELASARSSEGLSALVARTRTCGYSADPEGDVLAANAREVKNVRKMVALQERIDFEVYRLFGLQDEVPAFVDEIAPGARPFEVQMVRDGVQTAWFARQGYQLPDERALGTQDLNLSAEVKLIEGMSFKRRWTIPEAKRVVEDLVYYELQALIEAVVRSLTEPVGFRRIERLLGTPAFLAVGSLALGADFDHRDVFPDFLWREAVPFLASYRNTDPGLEKRAAWERVWDLQRAEDRGEPVPPFDPPPKYDQKDYRDATTWRLRGKLDVPKERFISYPGCESDEDHEPVYGWAGWNHLQQAQALAALYQKRKTEESWSKERLTPMLAGLLELIPWVKQWHNEPSAEFDGLRLGDYFESFLDGECNTLGLTREDLRGWRPAAKGAGRKAGAARASKPPPAAEEGAEPAAPKRRGRKKEAAPGGEGGATIPDGEPT